MKFPPLIIVDEKQKWAHISIPKCACSSIRRALEVHFKLEPVATWEMVHERSWPCTKTLGWLSHRSPDWFTWAIIRNPFDRLVSVWQEKCCTPELKQRLGPQLQRLSGQPFDVFCKTICESIHNIPENEILDTHVAPMAHSLLYNEKCIVNTIREMHELDGFWNVLQERYGFPELKHLNVSIHKPSDSYYTPELRKLVEDAYCDDLKLWWGK